MKPVAGHRELKSDADYCCQFAATTRDTKVDVDAAMQQTHDKLIEDLGPRRLGGVQWSIYRAGQRFSVLDGVDEDYAELRAFMRRFPLGVLVMAFCEAER